MSDFDQTARFVPEMEPSFLPWLAAKAGLVLTFGEWFKERTPARPNSKERIADQVAILHHDTLAPWLFLVEFQTLPDTDKLDVTLEHAGILRSRARWGTDRQGRYQILTALVHLTGVASETERDLRTPTGFGTFHKPVIWDIATEDASAVLDGVAAGRSPLVLLYWLPLMQRGGEEIIIKRWREMVATQVTNRNRRADMVETALRFAELAGSFLTWERILEGFDMGESQVASRWVLRGNLQTIRQNLVKLLDAKFPGAMPPAVRQLIEQQESLPVLTDWFDAALAVTTYAEFDRVVRS